MDNRNYEYPINALMAMWSIPTQDIPDNAYELFEKVIHIACCRKCAMRYKKTMSI